MEIKFRRRLPLQEAVQSFSDRAARGLCAASAGMQVVSTPWIQQIREKWDGMFERPNTMTEAQRAYPEDVWPGRKLRAREITAKRRQSATPPRGAGVLRVHPHARSTSRARDQRDAAAVSTSRIRATAPAQLKSACCREGLIVTGTDFDVGVLLFSATLSIGTRALASG